MIQLLQSLSDGSTQLIDVPVPQTSAASLVVASRASLISAGTERALVDFGRASMLEKARQQPDKVRQVLEKIRADGVAPTLEAVRSKLGAPIPLGYCQAGIVTEVGRSVSGFAPGDRVATNGCHAEYVRVPHTLAARIPDAVSFEAAAFAPVAAIALQGLRLANPTLGETVVVYGLGLIGQLAVQLVRASGCQAIGVDTSPERVELATRSGARGILAREGADVAEAVLEATGGVGADVVLLTLATSSSEPVHAAATMARKRGRIVLVGVAGLELRREDFYKKELSFQVSCSYGPGRYDPTHEEGGIDYPLAYVRWTEARNFAAVLGLMADGRVDPLPLVTHRFSIEQAERAYDVVTGAEPSLGIVLSYSAPASVDGAKARSVSLRSSSGAQAAGRVAFIGSGNFASRMLIPAFAAAGAELEVIASSGGVSAAVVGRKAGFRRATTDADAVLSDPAVDTVVIATRHDTHASWVTKALEAGKHVFVEKPLALTLEDVEQVREVAAASGRLLCVGFNRRAAPLTVRAKAAVSARSGPLVVNMLVNAGAIPKDHWTQDAVAGGGRIVGEACHFIDLARFLVGAPIRSVDVVSARSSAGPVDDVAVLSLGFADGSIASIQYLANGHRAFPKERVELIFDGKIVRLDNFRRLEAWGANGVGTRWPQRQDKGHAQLVRAFVDAVRTGGPAPIPLAELVEVSAAAVRAGVAARSGGDRG